MLCVHVLNSKFYVQCTYMYMVTCTLHVRLLKCSVSHTCRINDQFPSPYAHIISPPLPDSLPDDLKDLLQKLLEKDQKKRITIPQIREHPWILKSTRPIPSREENCNVEISVSEEDMEQAFKTYRTPIHILVSVGPDCPCLDSILHFTDTVVVSKFFCFAEKFHSNYGK